jgi:Zn-dependent peptidase ImmA (M78 family)
MHDNQTTGTGAPSVLASLRALAPQRHLRFAEALRLAELQACKLLELNDIADGPVPNEVVSELARVQVVYRDLPTSGMSYWNGRAWVVCLNSSEPVTRQRFTLLHEFKHIIDHGRASRLYTGTTRVSGEEQAEQVADYFAGCALMPKRLMKRAWGDGIQRPALLAARFKVSPRAAAVRLAQLGLDEPVTRCATSPRMATPRRRSSYYRTSSWHWNDLTAVEVAS